MRNFDKYFDGAVAHLPLNESGRDAIGSSHGTPTSGARFGAQGAVFDGVDDYINLGTPIPPRLSLITSPLTIMCWVKHNINGTFNYIVNDFDSGASNSTMGIYRQSANKWGFWHGSGANQVQSTTLSTVGLWTHVCGTRTGTTGAWTLRIYINGKLETTGSLTTLNPVSGGQLAIGRPGSYTGGLTMNGCIADMNFINRPLTLNEIQEHYVNTRGLYL
jgi:hypothetical protein